MEFGGNGAMRVLFVSTSTTIGGAEKTLFSLATRLEPKEFEVAGAVSLKPLGFYADRLAERGIKTHSLGVQRWPLFAHTRALAGIIRREKPDIIHALMYQAMQLCRFVKPRAGVRFKLISSPRVSYRTRSFWTLAVDRMLRGADDLLISESDASRDFLVGRLGYAADKVRTIYNGIDIAEQPAGERDSKRRELGLGAEDVLIGAIGRLDEQKGHAYLVEAMSRMRNLSRAHCVIMGDGPLRGKLEARIRRLGLKNSVRLLGEVDDASSRLSALDIFVLPSLWEGLPNALLEAMAHGLPAAASSVDGVCEAVEDGVTGFLVPPKDPDALAGALSKLIADAQTRRRMGAAGRARVAERFSFSRMLASYEAAYREVVSRP
ncbi:MAG: glycosyltransferase [Elusimicrobia bacterium]|nr:glycosyltransferase [Elusimicrobiota bacterium]